MAKDKKKQTNGVVVEDVVAEALTSPETPVVEEATSSAPAATPTARTSATVDTRTPPPAGVVDTAASTASDVARFVHSVVPQRLPAYLGGAALLVFGLVDPPVVLGGVLAYEAIRRWNPAPRA
jgi:hypothetical protein